MATTTPSPPSENREPPGWIPPHVGTLSPAKSVREHQLHLAALDYSLATPITINGPKDIQSRPHWSQHFQPFEHQVQNLITFCRRAPVAMIADDVGLGKTISAGLVMSELMVRKKVSRVLVLAPRILLGQWKEELASKFKIDGEYGTGPQLDLLLRTSCPVVITTWESARDRFDRIRQSFFDFLILDEAHKIRNLVGPSKTTPKIASVIHDSLERRDFKYVLMLSATPIQNSLWDLYSVIKCLTVAKGHENPLGSPEYFKKYYLQDGQSKGTRIQRRRIQAFRHTLAQYIVRTTRSEARLPFPERDVATVSCDPTSGERDLERVLKHSIQGLNRLAQISLAQALMSSPAAFVTQLRNMRSNEKMSPDIVDAAERVLPRVGSTGKVEELLELIRHLSESDPRSWRLVVFTIRRETQDFIGSTLAKQGIDVGFIRGAAGPKNERTIASFKEDPPGVHVIVSTDAGAEGVNLQVANVLVNYDLPWNPMVVEQRIGRIQRLGSRFRRVLVRNLVIRDSIEEHVVARLLEKLQAVSNAIGDIEGILEASDQGDGEALQEQLRTLILEAMKGRDVTEATDKIQASIVRAKQRYEDEKRTVEQHLGSLNAMHETGPVPPDFEPAQPRMSEKKFVLESLAADGCQVESLEFDRFRVRPPGELPYLLTFDENDPDLLDAGARGFGGTNVKYAGQGKPFFEQLVGRWSRTAEAMLHDPAGDEEPRAHDMVRTWLKENCPEVRPNQIETLDVESHFAGELDISASAQVAHDRFEKLCTVRIGRTGAPQINKSPDCLSLVTEPIRPTDLIQDIADIMRGTVESDDCIGKFREFYRAREREELEQAGENLERRRQVRDQLGVELGARGVALRGIVISEYVLECSFAIEDAAECGYTARFRVEPISNRVREAPEIGRCTLSGVTAPTSALAECDVSSEPTLRHLLVPSEGTERLGRPDETGRCEATGAQLLTDELGRSELSGKKVDRKLLVACAVSGKLGLEAEMTTCEITGAKAAPDEISTSEVSGRRFRSDERSACSVSGVRGHQSEFSRCAATGATLAPDECGRSSYSGEVVRRDLLRASEKNPERVGTPREMRVCAVTDKALLLDELGSSDVSGALADDDLLVRSSASGRRGLPEEARKCEETHETVLVDETDVCALSKKRVDRRLLERSRISGKKALARLLATCQETGDRALPEELVTCEASGSRVAPRLTVKCAVTSKIVLERLSTECAITGDRIMQEVAIGSARTGRLGRPDRAVRCDWTNEELLQDEVGKCEFSGLTIDSESLDGGVIRAFKTLVRDAARESATSPSECLRTRVLPKVPIRRLWASPSGSGTAWAVLADCSGMFGLKKRHALFVVRGSLEDGELLGTPRFGRLQDGEFHSE